MKIGDHGPLVQCWQTFLTGRYAAALKADGIFGPKTAEATSAFQSAQGLEQTGEVDSATLQAATTLGYLQPVHVLSAAEKNALFGELKYKIKDGKLLPDLYWIRDNLDNVTVPVEFGKGSLTVPFHKKGATALVKLFETWQATNVLDRVLTFDGSYAPRFVRGSTTVISSHAWGTAFDINARWNGLGCDPASCGERGSVVELVKAAEALGFVWGGNFSRKDGMHFELSRLV